MIKAKQLPDIIIFKVNNIITIKIIPFFNLNFSKIHQRGVLV